MLADLGVIIILKDVCSGIQKMTLTRVLQGSPKHGKHLENTIQNTKVMPSDIAKDLYHFNENIVIFNRK